MRQVLICAVMLLTSTGLFAQADRAALVDEVVTVLDREMNRELLVWMASTIAVKEISPGGVKETETAGPNARLIFQKFFHSREFTSLVLRPWVEETFTTAELQDVAKMLRAPAGQKLISAVTGSPGTLMERAATHLRPQLMESLFGQRGAEEMTRLSKIKRTAADIRTLATASEAYAIDNKGFPPARDLDELDRFLSPTYVKRMPRLDAWGNPLQYIVSQDRTHYRILSGGADGIIEPRHQHIEQATSSIQLETGDDTSADLVFQDGRFAVVPASLQSVVARRP
jgi:hypothetical protein